MSHHCTITPHETEDVVILRLTGDFDMAVADALRLDLAAALQLCPRLVLDLRETAFLDSLCLGAIVGARNRARGTDGWVRLVAPSGNVSKVLQVTGLDEVFDVFEDVDRACAVTAGSVVRA